MRRPIRAMYVFDPRVINEDSTRAHSLKLIRDGFEDTVVIHKHKAPEECPHDLLYVSSTKQLPTINPDRCYYFDKETNKNG